MTKLWLAIDGGNSKTDVILGDEAGNLLAFVRGPGASPQTLGIPTSLSILERLVRATRAERPVARADFYMAGLDLPEEVQLTGKAVEETGWAEVYHVDNDTFALLRAGTDSPDAVAVVCGAGINCVGRTGDGRYARYPALGMLSGDWGGGQHLAALALWHAARAADGRGPATALEAAVAAHCGAATVGEVVAGVHLGSIPRELLDDLSELLFRVADAGDAVARRVVARQAKEIVALATAAADRLDLGERQYDVVLGGGVIRARHRLLNDAVEEGILSHSRHARVSVVVDPPVLGAGLSALDALAAPAEAASALRASLREARPQIIS